MKGKDLKNKKVTIIANDKEYELALDMNALCELEEIYGDIKVAINTFKEKPMRTVRAFIYAMLKSQNPKITILDAGAIVNTSNFNDVVNAITTLIEDAFPKNEENKDTIEDSIEEKNV